MSCFCMGGLYFSNSLQFHLGVWIFTQARTQLFGGKQMFSVEATISLRTNTVKSIQSKNVDTLWKMVEDSVAYFVILVQSTPVVHAMR